MKRCFLLLLLPLAPIAVSAQDFLSHVSGSVDAGVYFQAAMDKPWGVRLGGTVGYDWHLLSFHNTHVEEDHMRLYEPSGWESTAFMYGVRVNAKRVCFVPSIGVAINHELWWSPSDSDFVKLNRSLSSAIQLSVMYRPKKPFPFFLSLDLYAGQETALLFTMHAGWYQKRVRKDPPEEPGRWEPVLYRKKKSVVIGH